MKKEKVKPQNAIREIWKYNPIKDFLEAGWGKFGVVLYYILAILSSAYLLAALADFEDLTAVVLALPSLALPFLAFFGDTIILFVCIGDIIYAISWLTDTEAVMLCVVAIIKTIIVLIRYIPSFSKTIKLIKKKQQENAETAQQHDLSEPEMDKEIIKAKQEFIQKYVIDISKKTLSYYMLDPNLCPLEILLDRDRLFQYIKENQDTSFETFKSNYYGYCNLFLEEQRFNEEIKEKVLDFIADNLKYLPGQESVDDMIKVQDSMLGQFKEKLQGTVNYDSLTMNGLMTAAEELGIPELEQAILQHMKDQGYSK